MPEAAHDRKVPTAALMEVAKRFHIIKPLHRPDAFHARDGRRHVAIEVVPAANHDVAALRRSIQLAATLDHPNVCRMRELVEIDDQLVIVSQLVEGVSIADRLLVGPFDPLQVGVLIGELLSALTAAHGAGLTHGAISPSTVVIDDTGKLRLMELGVRLTGTPKQDLEATATLATRMLESSDAPVPRELARWIERCPSFPDAKIALAALHGSDASSRDTPRQPLEIVKKPAKTTTITIPPLNKPKTDQIPPLVADAPPSDAAIPTTAIASSSPGLPIGSSPNLTLMGHAPAPVAAQPSAAPDKPSQGDATKPVEKLEGKPVVAIPAKLETRPDVKPVEAKSVEAKPVEAKPAEAKPIEAKPAEAKPAAKPVDAKPAAKPVDAKPASMAAEPVAEPMAVRKPGRAIGRASIAIAAVAAAAIVLLVLALPGKSTKTQQAPGSSIAITTPPPTTPTPPPGSLPPLPSNAVEEPANLASPPPTPDPVPTPAPPDPAPPQPPAPAKPEPVPPPPTATTAPTPPATTTAKPAPTPRTVRAPSTGEPLAVINVTFSAESSWIEKPAVFVLEEAYRQLVKNPLAHVEIWGHSSTEGEDRKNQAISMGRAMSVKAYLINRGIEEGRIVIGSRGASAPIADNDTPEGRAQNRRAELRIVSSPLLPPAAAPARTPAPAAPPTEQTDPAPAPTETTPPPTP